MSSHPRDRQTDVTGLLLAWRNGQESASRALASAVYGELKALARAYMRRERAEHSLPPTALVHEAYVRLIDQRRVRWQNRAHFYGIAARLMRRILVDHARARAAEKRGGSRSHLPLDEATDSPAGVDVLALDLALSRLATQHPRQARVVELRFFGRLTEQDTAEVLRSSRVTVQRDWAYAKTWLYRELKGSGA